MSADNARSCHGEAGRKRQFAIRGGQVDVWAGYYPAVIVHPSLGSPLIVADEKRISLFIIAAQSLRKAFLAGNGHDATFAAAGADNVRQIVNQHLKIHLWETVNADRRDLSKGDRPLFAQNATHQIDCYYLGKLGEELHDRQGRHFANLRASTRNQFAAMNLGEVFQIDISGYPFVSETLYDAYWAVRDSGTSAQGAESPFLDLSDLRVMQFVAKTWRGGRGADHAGETAGKGPLCAFKVDAQKGVTFAPDPAVALQSRHPIVIPAAGKDRLNFGHLSDVHLSARQHAYKGRQATVIPEVSEPIGELANNNADNFFDLLAQFGSDPQVDVLIITGDLYDHLHNFDPASRDTATTGQLWEAMYVDSIKAVRERAEEYPYGIDGLAVYSLLVDFYTRYRKPVLLISGNHEAYEYPYGISPRKKAIGRVNEGIPLDHNLTIYEAILLYGPGYDKVLKDFNFSGENFDWFATVFSPLADVALTYNHQCLVGLEWGNDESFARSKIRGGGTLPRAMKSPGQSQRALIDASLTEGKETVLYSHFTLINYSLEKSLEETGVIDIHSAMFSDYDHGASHGDRSSLYQRFINHPKLKLSLAGHSHRAGLYVCDQLTKTIYPAGSGRMGVSHDPAQAVEYVPQVKTSGYYPEDPATKNAPWKNRTRVFVTASTGPVPKQNLKGEMSGQGMEFPSAGKIVFNGSEPEIRLVKTRSQSAKPRFAVACDYLDLMKDGFWEHFKAMGSGGEFELKVCWEKIHPNFPPEKKGDFIESVTLWLVGDDESQRYSGANGALSADGKAIRIKFGKKIILKIKSQELNLFGAIFLSIKFSAAALSHLPGFKDYDYDSPWNIQVGIYDKWGRDVAAPKQENQGLFGKLIEKTGITKASSDSSTWQIMRHKKFGEVPYFRWRSQQWPSEFKYNLKKS